MKALLIIILLLAVIGGIILGIYTYIERRQKPLLERLEKSSELLKAESVPIKFKILEKNRRNINLSIKFYNDDGKEIDKETLKLKGQEISFDFMIIPIGDEKYIAFPYLIFTDEIPPKKGTTLYKYYDIKGVPAIFQSEDADASLMSNLEELFDKLKKGENLGDGQFGNAVHDVKELKTFTPGIVYKIVCRTKGGIEIIED